MNRRQANGKNIFIFYDAPNFAAEAVGQRVVVDTFVEIGGAVRYHLHWERYRDAKGAMSYENVRGRAVQALPDWAVDTLRKDEITYEPKPQP